MQSRRGHHRRSLIDTEGFTKVILLSLPVNGLAYTQKLPTVKKFNIILIKKLDGLYTSKHSEVVVVGRCWPLSQLPFSNLQLCCV